MLRCWNTYLYTYPNTQTPTYQSMQVLKNVNM